MAIFQMNYHLFFFRYSESGRISSSATDLHRSDFQRNSDYRSAGDPALRVPIPGRYVRNSHTYLCVCFCTYTNHGFMVTSIVAMVTSIVAMVTSIVVMVTSVFVMVTSVVVMATNPIVGYLSRTVLVICSHSCHFVHINLKIFTPLSHINPFALYVYINYITHISITHHFHRSSAAPSPATDPVIPRTRPRSG